MLKIYFTTVLQKFLSFLLRLVLSFCCYMSRLILGNQPDVVPLQNMDLIGSLFQIRVKFASVIICSARSLDSLWFRPWFLTNRLKLLKLRWDIFRWNVTHTLVLSNWANIKISVDARLCVYSITFTFTICYKALVRLKWSILFYTNWDISILHMERGRFTPNINCVSRLFGKLRFLHENVGILARNIRKWFQKDSETLKSCSVTLHNRGLSA